MTILLTNVASFGTAVAGACRFEWRTVCSGKLPPTRYAGRQLLMPMAGLSVCIALVFASQAARLGMLSAITARLFTNRSIVPCQKLTSRPLVNLHIQELEEITRLSRIP